MLVDLARSLAPSNGSVQIVDVSLAATGWAALLDEDGESPYRD
jgi:hypothetical protein